MQVSIKSNALEDTNNNEMTILIANVCEKMRLDKYNKGIHAIIKRNVINIDSQPPVKKSTKVKKTNNSVIESEIKAVRRGRASIFNLGNG